MSLRAVQRYQKSRRLATIESDFKRRISDASPVKMGKIAKSASQHGCRKRPYRWAKIACVRAIQTNASKRRGQDSNLRYIAVNSISSAAPSTTRPPLQWDGDAITPRYPSQSRFFQRHRADVAAAAGGAAAAFPEGVELGHHLVDHLSAGGGDAHLEVAPPVGFGAQARAGEVG